MPRQVADIAWHPADSPVTAIVRLVLLAGPQEGIVGDAKSCQS